VSLRKRHGQEKVTEAKAAEGRASSVVQLNRNELREVNMDEKVIKLTSQKTGKAKAPLFARRVLQ